MLQIISAGRTSSIKWTKVSSISTMPRMMPREKHWIESHPEMLVIPIFKFKIVITFKDSLSRQVAESFRIDLRGDVINSTTMYSRNLLLRLEKPEWERSEDERRRKSWG